MTWRQNRVSADAKWSSNKWFAEWNLFSQRRTKRIKALKISPEVADRTPRTENKTLMACRRWCRTQVKREGGKTNSRVTVILLSVLSWRRLLNNWFFPDVEERKREREKSEPKLRRELSQSSTFFLSWERKLLVGCLDWRREYSLKFILRSLPYNLHHHELRLLQKPRIEPSLESDT